MNKETQNKLYQKSKNLVDKLRTICDHPSYNSVWSFYHAHGMIYDGPTFESELKELLEFFQENNSEK